MQDSQTPLLIDWSGDEPTSIDHAGYWTVIANYKRIELGYDSADATYARNLATSYQLQALAEADGDHNRVKELMLGRNLPNYVEAAEQTQLGNVTDLGIQALNFVIPGDYEFAPRSSSTRAEDRVSEQDKNVYHECMFNQSFENQGSVNRCFPDDELVESIETPMIDMDSSLTLNASHHESTLVEEDFSSSEIIDSNDTDTEDESENASDDEYNQEATDSTDAVTIESDNDDDDDDFAAGSDTDYEEVPETKKRRHASRKSSPTAKRRQNSMKTLPGGRPYTAGKGIYMGPTSPSPDPMSATSRSPSPGVDRPITGGKTVWAGMTPPKFDWRTTAGKGPWVGSTARTIERPAFSGKRLPGSKTFPSASLVEDDDLEDSHHIRLNSPENINSHPREHIQPTQVEPTSTMTRVSAPVTKKSKAKKARKPKAPRTHRPGHPEDKMLLGGWYQSEHDACLWAVRSQREREMFKKIPRSRWLRDVKFWNVVSNAIVSRNVYKVGTACKTYWSRFGRDLSQFDERVNPTNSMITSAQHPKNRRSD